MSYRIDFWPYDHQALLAVAGTCSDSKIDELLAEPISLLRYDSQAADLARSVLRSGFPVTKSSVETPVHYQATALLVRSHLNQSAVTESEFRYLPFLDLFDDTFYEPLPSLAVDFEQGRPWFADECHEDFVHGTLKRQEVATFADRCIQFADDFASSGCDIRPVLDVFQVAARSECDLWFTIG